MRNVVLVSIDSLRADHCGCYGYGRTTTPTLDSWARDGLRFENAVAPGPSTHESMPAVFTGEFPRDEDERGGIDDRDIIREHVSRHRTIPERLSDAGYATAGFSPNPFTSRHFGYGHGFDEYHDFLSDDPLGSSVRSRVVSRWMQGEFVAGLRFAINMLGVGDISTSWEDYYDHLRSWVRDAPEPYFLWVFLLEPHWPYRPPRRYRDRSVLGMYRGNWRTSSLRDAPPGPGDVEAAEGLYDGAIRHADEFLERVESELPGDPAVVVHADHGEEFGEHGHYGHRQLYDETLRVPLVVWNGAVSGSVTEPVTLRRLPRLVETVANDGDPSELAEPWAIARGSGRDVAVRGRRWKYIDREDPECYLLDSDPGESVNVVAECEELSGVARRLVTRYERHRTERRSIGTAVSDLDGI